MKALVISCKESPDTDSMCVSDAGHAEVIITNHEYGSENGEAKVYLDRDAALELLQWLALWLHK